MNVADTEGSGSGSGEPRAERRTQAERSESTRAQLLAAGRTLFAERGYANVGTEEIVRAAGVTRGALYHHFNGKQELFRAVFEEMEAELAKRFATEALARDDPWEAMLAGIEMYLEISSDPAAYRIGLIDAPAVVGYAQWREIGAKTSLGLIELGLQNMIDAGMARRQRVEPLAHAILGTLEAAGRYVAEADDVETARREMSEVLRSLLEGFRETP